MDPVIGSIVVAIISGTLGGFALIRSGRTNTTASATRTLVEGQATAIQRLEGQVAARDSTIEDLHARCDEQRQRWEECEEKHRQLEVRFNAQGVELARLRARITEMGDERLP